MLILISPAKKLNLENNFDGIKDQLNEPIFIKTKTSKLIDSLKTKKTDDFKKLMKLSDNLARLNYQRYQEFKKSHSIKNSYPAVFTFDGDTYTGLQANKLNKSQLKKAQKQLRILSGLYGILKPLDLIQPYRLEMGTKYKIQDSKNLYEFWKEDITRNINQELNEHKLLINLASQEYFGAVETKNITSPIITPVFKENKNGTYKIISFNAKKARGLMAYYIITNNCKTVDDLKKFNLDGYKLNNKLSTENEPVFTRG